ncbi:MAG TPA: MerR family DNA-binding transcriptional regulator [Pseudonocardiaceae bacterium]
MADTELMSIGAFAKLAGLTASALRFYDDAGPRLVTANKNPMRRTDPLHDHSI